MGDVTFPVQRRGRGWAMRCTSWVMRLVGGAAVLISAFRGRSLASAVNAPGYDGPPFFVAVLMYAGIMIVGSVLLVGSLSVGRRARVLLARTLPSVAGLLPGSYVLYLRPFTQDLISSGIAPAASNSNAFANPVQAIARSGRTYEERLGRTFRKYGPLVAVGRPGEELPGGSGAQRTYLPLDDWKDTVRELMDNARLIILGAGPGPGTVWEYVEVMRRREPSRLVILVTDVDDYLRFKASSIAEAEGVLFELKRKYGDFWQPPVLPELPAPANPKTSQAFFFKAMVYFSEGWEPHLAHFDRSAVKGSNQRRLNKYFTGKLNPVLTHIDRGARAPDR
ncbi:hypothetical protein E6W39_09710 [Kitasatospora acidiphila]|uniref:Uncharacterized protein n=1 Tax=Kitasatospora acidiphila TaxID=2567942 RepID=A0A540W0E9_9ACTN|nr:hypothetical protein [Kitasatospora acidiphila]TQF02499.1 hypothetical protein E6W39_09710 [Kitasatospora acidiphila]